MKPLTPDVDGSFVLRPERVYRLVVVVNGPTTCDALEGALVASGFEGPIASAPQDWASEKPEDWPKEPLIAACANECIVRVSLILRGKNGHAVRLVRDGRIDDDATYTVAAAWDYCAAPAPTRTGAATPAPAATTTAPTRTSTGKDKGPGALAIGIALAFGVGAWSWMRSSDRYKKEEEKYLSAAAKAEREELFARVQHYLDRGDSQWDAQDKAERDIAARDMRRMSIELGGGNGI